MARKKQYKEIEINEYGTTARVYDEELSIKDARKERQENEKIAKIGKPLFFLASDFSLQYPNLKDNKGNVLYQVINGKKFPIKDTDRAPFWSVYKGNKEKGASVSINNAIMVELLERAISANYGSDKTEQAVYLEKLLDDVFPITKIDFGTFLVDGPRELDIEKAALLPKSKISLYSLPLLDTENNPIIRKSLYEDDGGNIKEREIHIYGATPEDGAQIGIKGGK